jgi:hypothetical protein
MLPLMASNNDAKVVVVTLPAGGATAPGTASCWAVMG